MFMKVSVPHNEQSSNLGRLHTNPQHSVEKLLPIVFSTLLAVFFSLSLYAQNTTRVTGRVVSEAGQPVPKVSVVVKGTTNGVTGNDNGDFEINAPANGTLVISSVGYTTLDVPINSRASIEITLKALSGSMSEVIVVGYGTQRKEAVTGSVASINGDKMREIPAPNISQALQGRLAGVEMTQTSTRPGATMQIRVRGTRSLSADNNPLIVLDGIPFIGSIADINPNDIKSIEVLKDASATAIYGSRGANGVILVTTEKGTRNRKPRISYNTYTGAQKVFAKYPMMDGPEFVALRAASGRYTNGQDESNDINTDWQDLFYKTGLVTDHAISLSGGSETGSYNFGLGYYLNQGVIPTQQYKRYSLRGSVDQGVGKYFRFGFTTYGNYNESEGNQVGLYNTLSMAPPIGVFTNTFAEKTLDSRYDGTFSTVYRGNWPKGGATNTVLYNANDMQITPGQPVLSFLEYESQAAGIVYPTGASFAGKTSDAVGAGQLPGRADFVVAPRGISRIVFPGLWKMGTYRTDNGTGLGQPNATLTRPFKIAKFSELYFIAAEAAVKGATTVAGKSARELINVIRARAGKWRFSNKDNAVLIADNSAAMTAATPSTIDINYILAERSREYFGEGLRWFDLVRTQKWSELAGTYEICGTAYGDHTPVTVTRTIDAKYYLRPIPQGQLDGMEMTADEKAAYQNPGYQ